MESDRIRSIWCFQGIVSLFVRFLTRFGLDSWTLRAILISGRGKTWVSSARVLTAWPAAGEAVAAEDIGTRPAGLEL